MWYHFPNSYVKYRGIQFQEQSLGPALRLPNFQSLRRGVYAGASTCHLILVS